MLEIPAIDGPSLPRDGATPQSRRAATCTPPATIETAWVKDSRAALAAVNSAPSRWDGAREAAIIGVLETHGGWDKAPLSPPINLLIHR